MGKVTLWHYCKLYCALIKYLVWLFLMTHAINTVSAKLIAKLKESREEVAKLLSFFLHCILITPNQRPIAIDVDFFLKQRALSLVISRSHGTYYNV